MQTTRFVPNLGIRHRRQMHRMRTFASVRDGEEQSPLRGVAPGWVSRTESDYLTRYQVPLSGAPAISSNFLF